MAATLTCKQCGHANEAERVYCHNCGAKLDRSLLPQETSAQKETAAQQQRRVRKLTTPMRGFFAGWQRSLINVLFWAALISAIVQMARKPDGIPPVLPKEQLADTPPLGTIIEDDLNSRTPQRLAISEDLINKYLQNTVKAKSNDALSGVLKFDRAFANLSEGACRITLQHSLFGWPIYVSTVDQLSIANNAIAATSIGGNIGRLPIHPWLMQYSDVFFRKLWDALKREHGLMDKMQSVEVHPAQFVAITKPPKTAAR
jgi:hypothetical protein